MKIQQFLEHHGIASNPFADEDAQTDRVFKAACIHSTYHPTWDKIYGDPKDPATAVVFGEKGSGKTALRLQIVDHLAAFNADHPEHQVFVIQYDDFNAYLDRLRDRFSGRRRKAEKALEQWRLWDHIDAILALGATQLVDRLLEVKQARHPAARDEALPISLLDAAHTRDVMLLAACYDQSTAENPLVRWNRLKKKLRFPTWKSKLDLVLGVGVTVAAVVLAFSLGLKGTFNFQGTTWFFIGLLTAIVGWLPFAWRFAKWQYKAMMIVRSTRVLNHPVSLLRRIFLKFPAGQIVGQPLPSHARTDDRYELLAKLQGVLRALKIEGIEVLVDRVDEPYLINGSTDLMRLLVWPMLDNKFLKHPGLGLKLLLPIELERLIDREDRDFHQRSRLDKQNLIRSLAWTGQSLYDVANARIKACAENNQSPSLAELFNPEVAPQRLMNAFAGLRVPRHLFKFMYRLFTEHCNAHSDENPVWQITAGTFEATLAVYQRDQDAFDRGVGAG
jgi:hypothetical protein